MAGTLVISTLSDGTNSTSSTNCIQGSAKAWVKYAGASGAVSASYNVSSVTRNGTGDCTVNFTNAMVDANYSVVGMCSLTSRSVIAQIWTQASASVQIATSSDSGAAYDVTAVCISIFR